MILIQDRMPVTTTTSVHILKNGTALVCGTDVDKHRNLAKSVTVE